MDTQVRTPQLVFTQPQRLVVPLFQRPYVWTRDSQWDPLWQDIRNLAERFLKAPTAKHFPHFLGAVVLQQVSSPTGLMQERTIIDGQQRLTTLQLFLDALHGRLLAFEIVVPALRIEPLVENAQPFRTHPEDRFKVWPTNRDRPAFNAVMGAEAPADYAKLGFAGERMVDAHRFFSNAIDEWLQLNGPEEIEERGSALETVSRELLQMVVIDLSVEENAQEIFETLNARGAPLTAADLIKNFVFQRLLEDGAEVQSAYERYWKEFETAFWEAESSLGRVRYPRSSIFLNHWLVSKMGQEVLAREVFSRFKSFATFGATKGMAALLEEIAGAASVYRSLTEQATNLAGPIDRLGLFAYRTGVLESEVVKPLLLYLLDPEEIEIDPLQLNKALDSIESWMVRRMLVRATTQNYNQLMAEMVSVLRKEGRDRAGDVLTSLLSAQSGASLYWPDDDEVRSEVQSLLAYRRLRRGRLRMVLEAIEDHLRGFDTGRIPMGNERVARGKLHIEHVMPQKWQLHWPLGEVAQGDERDRLVHTIGNLTLLPARLNNRVSNGPWIGADGKRHGLQAHDVLFLNRRLLDGSEADWSEASIRARSAELADIILQIWPAPEGHRSGFAHEKTAVIHTVDLLDLINAGWLEPGCRLVPRKKGLETAEVVLLADGRIDVGGQDFASPSKAASALTGTSVNGWWFFLVDGMKKTLRDIRRDYLESFSDDVDDEDGDDDL